MEFTIPAPVATPHVGNFVLRLSRLIEVLILTTTVSTASTSICISHGVAYRNSELAVIMGKSVKLSSQSDSYYCVINDERSSMDNRGAC